MSFTKQRWVAVLVTSVYGFACQLGIQTNLQAQPILSAPDGTNTIVNQTGNTFNIQRGSLSRDGANLFHSFQRFGLSADQIANFLANPNIRNILGRIVGGDPSVIDGLIRVTGGNPNLFLINPAGIIFGPNIRLDVPGDFTATTATRIGFGNDRWFNVFTQSNYANLVGTPSLFMFDAAQSGSIINAGQLSLQPGKTLLLLGSNVINTGQLSAPNGNITVAAVPGTGRVQIGRPGGLLSLEVQATTHSGQPIPITPLDLPKLLTVGAAGLETGVTVTSESTVQLANSSVPIPITPGTTVISGQVSVMGQQPASFTPEINVLGDRVALINANLDASGVNGGTIRIGGDYQGKGTVPNAQFTFIDQTSRIRADGLPGQTGTPAQGGNVFIWADNTTRFHGTVTARGGVQGGNGGFVEVSGKQNLTVGGTIDVSAPLGLSGTVLFDPLDIQIVAGAGINDAELADGSIFAADGVGIFTIGADALVGITGNIRLEATRDIILDTSLTLPGTPGSTINFSAGRTINGEGQSITAAGRNLELTAESIAIANLDTSVDPASTASGGNITLRATNGTVTTGALKSDSSSPTLGAKGGDVRIESSGAIAIDGNIQTGEDAQSGNITLKSTGGDITVTGFASASGNLQPGSIQIEAAGKVTAESVLSIDNRPDNPANPTIISVKGREIEINDILGNRNTRVQGLPEASGLVSLQAEGAIKTGNINNQGYPIQITSTTGSATTGDLDTSGPNGGNVAINAPGGITTGVINSSGDPFNGGNVTLETRKGVRVESINTQSSQGLGGDVNVNIINAQGGENGSGGNVNVGTDQFFQATGTFTDQNEVLASISTAGGQGGGNIRIEQGNSEPFGVGDLSQRNGTAGAITTGEDTLAPVQIIRAPYINGKIQILKPVPQVPTPTPPDPPNPPRTPRTPNPDVPSCFPSCGLENNLNNLNTELPKLLYEDVETQFTQEFEDYLGVGQGRTRIKNLSETREELKKIRQKTGVRTALVYIVFRKPGVLQQLIDLQLLPAEIRKQLRQDKDKIDDYELHILVVTEDGIITQKRVMQEVTVQGKQEKIPVTHQDIKAAANDLVQYIGVTAVVDSRYIRAAEDLYTWLIKPIEPELQQAELQNKQIHHISFLAARSLRSIPFGALQNPAQRIKDEIYPCRRNESGEKGKCGERGEYLIEKYSTGLMPSFSLVDASYRGNLASSPMLAMGFSKDFPEGINSLNFVPMELEILEQKLWGTEGVNVYSRLDEQAELCMLAPDYRMRLVHGEGNSDPSQSSEKCPANPPTAQTRQKELAARPASNHPASKQGEDIRIIHLTTHGEFKQKNNSYLQFGAKKVTLSDISKLRLSDPPPQPIELLTLSACKTALGDPEAELGLAGMAVQSRVKSVMANLWKVSYRSGFVLSIAFYDQLKHGREHGQPYTKARALREAQLAMMQGKIKVNEVDEYAKLYTLVLPSMKNINLFHEPDPLRYHQFDPPRPDEDPSKFEHPGFWAGMTIVGNPW